MIASLTYTCAKHAALAAATSALDTLAKRKYWAVETADADMDVPADVTKIVCDFPFGGNLNGGAFLRGHASVLDRIFAEGADVVIKRDSDAVLLKLAIATEPLRADCAHVRGVQIGGCLSGGCYVVNRRVPAAIRTFLQKYKVPDAPRERDPDDVTKTRPTTYAYAGPVQSNRWTPTAEDLCVHRAVADVGGVVEIEEHYFKPIRHPLNGLPAWAPIALLSPLVPERIPALCEYVATLTR